MVSPTLEQFQSVRFAPSWRFWVQLPELDGIRPPPQVIVVGGNFSHPHVDSEARFRSGSYNYFPQFNDIEAIDIEFMETENYEVTEYLYNWFGLVVHDDGTYGLPDIYKKEVYLYLLGHEDENSQHKYLIRYNGAFPTRRATIDPVENDDFIRVSCNFSVDSNTPQGGGRRGGRGRGLTVSDTNNLRSSLFT